MNKGLLVSLITLPVLSVVVVAVFVYSTVQNQLKREYKSGYLIGRADEVAKLKELIRSLLRKRSRNSRLVGLRRSNS